MKKIKLLILLNFLLSFAAVNFSSAQNHILYGNCYSGGAASSGTIFKADLDGSNLQSVYSFVGPEGRMPWGKMVQAPNGKIYGTTFLGGCMDSCTIYEYDAITNACNAVYEFFCGNGPIGEPAQGGLTILPDGNIYGLQQNGAIYKFDPNTHVYTLLYQAPHSYNGRLMQASDGALYGLSQFGGTNNAGYIFRYDLSAQTFSLVYSFNVTQGGHPRLGSLIQATDGKLYGTTFDLGAHNKGVIFSYNISTGTYTDLYDFDGPTGANPYSGLIQAADGKLYGMTNAGGVSGNGAIFSYDIAASLYTVLYNFDFVNGANPTGALSQASNSILFGATPLGGATNQGTAFRYDIATGTYTKLIDFNYSTGSGPQCDIQEMTIENPTGISSASNASVSIYIASNQLVVRSPGFGDSVKIRMYDALGKNVLQSEIRNQQSEFDLSSYQRGVYFVQLKSNEKTVTQKIILSR